MGQIELIDRVIEPQTVLEGAGVKLKRSIATRELNYVDPFLLLDHFESENREDFEAGFPMHPHRGIETVTYILSGSVHHRDTLGNSGSIGAGDVQWMTSGRGIMHEEMPQVRPEGIAGFQLWVNLPANLKMSKPRYQDIRSNQIQTLHDQGGAEVKVVAGKYGTIQGPVTGIALDPLYLDVSIPPQSTFVHQIPEGYNSFAYFFQGEGEITAEDGGEKILIKAPRLAVLKDGVALRVTTREVPVRFLLVSGKPLNEPVARYGPFVMNSKQEIEQTLEELRRGTFIRND